MVAHAVETEGWFLEAERKFYGLVKVLESKESDSMTASEMEELIRKHLQGIGRDLIEGKMNEVGLREASVPVTGKDGVVRNQKELRERDIETSFGEVHYKRWGYGAKGEGSLFPADGHLNLPPEKYTLGVRQLVSEDVSRNSYFDVLEGLTVRSGIKVPKRQGLELVGRAVADFKDFYDKRSMGSDGNGEKSECAPTGSLLILTTDAKGVVMRHDGLREQTAQAAEQEKHKLDKRISRGEKRNRKRMAQVASVYTVEPHVRTAEDVVRGLKPVGEGQEKHRSPLPENKRVWASVERGIEEVLEEMFMEGQSRDTQHEKQWVALIDGNPNQLKELKKTAERFGLKLTVVLDIIHVLEYLWKAAWGFYEEGSLKAEEFVSERLLRLLHGKSGQVAKGIRKMATGRHLQGDKRKQVDKCADYLQKYASILQYDQYLARGLPIATGVIEGACRYLVKDRMDITGARWSLMGAEAVLSLRSLRTSGDFHEYWRYHEKMERERNHISKYINGLPPLQSNKQGVSLNKGHLRMVKGKQIP